MLRLCPGCLGEQEDAVASCSRCGHGLPSLTTSRTDRHCPDCDLPLLRYGLGGLPVEQCRGCLGVFVERQDLERLYVNRRAAPGDRRAAATDDSPALSAPSAREDVRYRRCPRCARLMRHRLLGTGREVILDMCAQDGTWFDRGELQKAVWLACSGGTEGDQDIEAADLQSRMEDLRKEREQARGKPAGPSSPDVLADPAVWWGEDLLTWLWSAD